MKNTHKHTPSDGRGYNRVVYLNDRVINEVVMADEKRGIVRVLSNPIQLDKYKKRFLTKILRGNVRVEITE